MEITVLGANDVRRLLPMGRCIELMHETMLKLGEGDAVQPLRTITPTMDGAGVLAMMPCQIGQAFGYKAVTVFPENARSGVPTHQGVVALVDPSTGSHIAFIDGTSITEIRTAAMSAVATRAMARPGSRVLAIIGSGAQARSHADSISQVLDLAEIRIWSRNHEHAQTFAREVNSALGASVSVSSSARDACDGADVIVTATSAGEPVISRSWISDGTHINAVGSCIPTAREIDTETVRDSIVIVDNLESALAEAGDLVIPLRTNAISDSHILGELGDALASGRQIRTHEDQLTLYESLGLGVQDIAAANHVHNAALESKRGTLVRL